MDRVSLTQQMRKQYGDENMMSQTQGTQLPDWPTWVRSQGMMLGSDGLVQVPQQAVTDALIDQRR